MPHRRKTLSVSTPWLAVATLLIIPFMTRFALAASLAHGDQGSRRAAQAKPNPSSPGRPSLGQVQQKFPLRQGLAYVKALHRLARDTQVPWVEREKALRRALAAVKDKHPLLRGRILQSQARLDGLRGNWRARRKHLRQAANQLQQAQKKIGAKSLRVLSVSEGLLPDLQRAARRQATKPRPLRGRERILLSKSQDLPKLQRDLADPLMALRVKAWRLPLLAQRQDQANFELESELQNLDLALAKQPDLAADRQNLLRWAASYYARAKHWPQALQASLAADRIQPLRPRQALADRPPLGRYCRSATTQALCQQALAQQAGDCVKLDAQLHGEACFFDYSQAPARAPFDPTQASQVLAEYSPLLHDCLRAAVKSGEIATGSKIELSWSISHAGRVSAHEIRPSRYQEPGFSQCIAAAFSAFRYPQYQGELKHIALQFRVD